MKTLFLSSNGRFAIEKGIQLVFGDVKKVKLAYITTAGNCFADEKKKYINEHKDLFEKVGCNFEELDIEGKNENEIKEFLNDKNAVYVEGGNTFYLLKAVRETGFDKAIKDLVEKGVPYFGSSAGSYIACPTIEMATWRKPGEERPRYGLTDLTALNFVPFLIKAHYNPDKGEFLREKTASVKYPVKFLKDGQALLVRGDKVKLIGEGEEIII